MNVKLTEIELETVLSALYTQKIELKKDLVNSPKLNTETKEELILVSKVIKKLGGGK
jgi:hypothetical protein